jgi:hypothetical protein
MATYYVRVDGNDANTGLGSSTAQAWQTISKALGATGIGSGDTLYIAPGTYRQGTAVTVGGTYSAMTYIYGDPTGAQFTGVPAGLVRITTFTPFDTSASSAVNAISATSKSNLTFANLFIETGTGSGIVFSGGDNILVENCVFTLQRGSAGQAGFYYTGGANTTGATVQRCQFFGGHTSIVINPTATTGQTFKAFVYDNICDSSTTLGICVAEPTNTTVQKYGIGCVVSNNIMSGTPTGFVTAMNNTGAVIVRNNTVVNATTGMSSVWTGAAVVASNNLLLSCSTNFSGISQTGGRTAGVYGFDIGEQFKFGLATLMRYTNWLASPNIAAGSTSDTVATDHYNVTWYSTTPDIGAVTYRNVQNILPTYAPTERNASTITIAPASTSQSIELYLGSTGLTYATSGLAAYYVRNREAPTPITLVTQTPTGAWSSGGFAEIDSSLVPGVYRLDVPNAAFAAGASDVTIVVRGASGTNGAVMTVKLSSGGLTEAQTASAVWGASPAGYATATTFGGVLNETNQVVNSTETIAQDIPGNVWDELKANHTIPNTFGDYLDTKVSTGADTARIQLRQGPFLIKQNAIDSVITEVNQFLSTVPNIEMVLIDSSGGSVSVAGSTLVMRVRNQAGTAVVNNITPTVAYADGGVIRWSPNLSWNALTVTTAGTYRIVVERTMSGVTTTFGPFLVQLSSG